MFQMSIRSLIAFCICTNLVCNGLLTIDLPVEMQHSNESLVTDPSTNASSLLRMQKIPAKLSITENKETQISDTNVDQNNIQPIDNDNSTNHDVTEKNHANSEQESNTSDMSEETTLVPEGTDAETTIDYKDDTTEKETTVVSITSTSSSTTTSPSSTQTISISTTSTPNSIVSTPTSITSMPNSSTSIPTETSSMEESTEGSIESDDSEISKLPLEEQPTDSMSSGTIALVMAIVFAIVVVLVYVALLAWRRYLEYRYGNRELLVNDLEFDTNDLRHFEL